MDYTHSHPSTFASLSNTVHLSPVSYTYHIPSSKQPPYLPICNASRPMCQVSSSYSLLLLCHCLRVMHCISCHHVHFICIHVRLMHPSIFPRCPFCIPALRSPPVVISTFFSCVGVNHFQIGPRLVMRPWFTTVDRLSSSIPFGLHLMLQWLTEGPRRPRVCCSPTPLHFGPKPTKTLSIT